MQAIPRFGINISPERIYRWNAIWERIYWMTMESVELEKSIKNEMFCIANSKENVFSKMTAFPEILERYFSSGRSILWAEYEEWYAVFKKNKEFPLGWRLGYLNLSNPKVDDFTLGDMLLLRLNMSEMKSILKFLSIEIPKGPKKHQLTELFMESNTINIDIQHVISSLPVVASKVSEYENKRTKSILYWLMRKIDNKTTNIENQENISRLAVHKIELISAYGGPTKDPVGDKYVNKYFKENPDDVPPFFPGDCTVFRNRFI